MQWRQETADYERICSYCGEIECEHIRAADRVLDFLVYSGSAAKHDQREGDFLVDSPKEVIL